MRRLAAIIIVLCSASTVFAQDAYDKIAAIKSSVKSIQGMRPAPDGEHYTLRRGNVIERRAYADRSRSEVVAEVPFDFADYSFSPDGQTLLLSDKRSVRPIYRHSFSADYLLMPLGGEPVKVLEGVRDVSFSPDGRHLAFAKDNNLYLYDIAAATAIPLTCDGQWNSIINGTSDWVYEEEYGFTRAYSFSPDGSRIAWLRFDESEVPMASIVRYDGMAGDSVLTFKYPRAGERNSAVQLMVCDIATGRTERIDTGSESDQYILQPSWTPAGELWFFRINRRQNHIEAVLQRADGTQKVIYDEQSPLYVDRPDSNTLVFIDGDRFLVREETTAGWWHLYLHSISRGRLNAVTSGEWEVTSLVAADKKYAWYLSTETSPLRRNLYRINLNGKGKRRLTDRDGFYTVAAGAGMRYYTATFSNTETPDIVTVHRGDGTVVDTLLDNRKTVVAGKPRRDFFSFTTERGDELNGYMVLPAGFDPSQRYPVLLTQYSGPASQQAADRWRLDWEDALADCGYIVVCADGRGTGFRGEAFKKSTYGHLGELEVEDQLSLARHMAARGYVDAGRIGIYGWSYGGFMALSCALKGDGLFKMAIAVAPVTSWRYYDTIYTETYNGLPQDNAAGYDDFSPVNFASRLHDRTRLMIMHGTADDNVHLKNSMEMMRALTAAGKQFDLMLYPDQNHSMLPDGSAAIRRKMLAYTLGNL